MEIGEIQAVSAGNCSDRYYVETGMYDTTGYGTVYVLDEDRPAIVETGIGTNADLLVDAVERVGIDPVDVSTIAVTHIHLDHAGGAGYLAEACPNADVYVPSIGVDHLVDPARLVSGTKHAVGDAWRFYADPKPIPRERIVSVEDGDSIDLGPSTLDVYEAPGHAPHQVVYADPANDAVFTGDAAGLWVPPLEKITVTSPPPQFDLEQCLADLETLEAIDPSVLLYTHFGPRDVGDNLSDALATYGEKLTRWVDRIDGKRQELDDRDAIVEYFQSESDLHEAWGKRKANQEIRLNVDGVLTYLERREDGDD